MAQTMASMPGLRGTSRLNLINVPRPSNAVRVAVARPGLAVVVRAQQVGADDPETSRRAILGLVAVGLASLSSAQPVLAGAVPIKVGPPPPPSGGLRKLLIIFSFFL
uniref:Uncharacterized protein n=1 Tax=Rhizophora mucronata TaxID=61149 RepID=A0A2P2JFD7_RHIMU